MRSLLLVISTLLIAMNGWPQEDFPDVKHGVVFMEKGRFGGWPANNGAWSWETKS